MKAAQVRFPVAYHQTNDAGRADQVGRNRNPDQVLSRVFGPGFDDYRARWRAAERFEHIPEWPLHLDVDTNCTCNLKCVMCPLGAGTLVEAHAGKFLDFDVYRKVMEEGAARGLASIRLGLTGEPLLRPDILDFVRLARDLGILDIMLITNGQLLLPDLGRALIEAGLTRLMVSIDALNPATYLKIRSGGRLPQVVDNLSRFLDLRNSLGLGHPLVRVSFIRMSLNETEADGFLEFWAERADYVCLQEYANILERPEADFFPKNRKMVPAFRCPDPFTRMSLFANGDLFPCCSDFGRLAPLGNAACQTVSEIWNSGATDRLRAIHRNGRWWEDPVCARCARAGTAAEPEDLVRHSPGGQP